MGNESKYKSGQCALIWVESNLDGSISEQECTILDVYKDDCGYFYKIKYNIVCRGGIGRVILAQCPTIAYARENEIFAKEHN